MTSTPFWRKRSADKRSPSHASSTRIFLVQHLSRAKHPSSVASRHLLLAVRGEGIMRATVCPLCGPKGSCASRRRLLPAVQGQGIMCVTSPPRIRSGAGSCARCGGRRHRVHRIASVIPQPSTIVYEACEMHISQYFQRLTVIMKHTFSFHQRRGCLPRCSSSRAAAMMKISPYLQLSTPCTELPSTNVEACCLDAAAQRSKDDDAVCCPSPRLRGEGGAKRRMRGGLSPHNTQTTPIPTHTAHRHDALPSRGATECAAHNPTCANAACVVYRPRPNAGSGIIFAIAVCSALNSAVSIRLIVSMQTSCVCRPA
jgi:hypothetical protein